MKFSQALGLWLLLLAGGCERPPSGSAVTLSQVASSPPSADRFAKADVPPDNTMTNNPADLVGVWHTRPAGLRYPGPDIVVTITTDRIAAASGCVRFAWTYRFQGTTLQLRQAPAGSCEREPTPYEAAFAAGLERSTAVHRRGGGVGLVFEGPTATVPLFEHPR